MGNMWVMFAGVVEKRAIPSVNVLLLDVLLLPIAREVMEQLTLIAPIIFYQHAYLINVDVHQIAVLALVRIVTAYQAFAVLVKIH